MDSNSNIYVIEPNMNSFPHSEINSGFLYCLQSVFNANQKYFFADKKHISSIEKIINLDKWNRKFIKVYAYSPKNFILNEILLIFRITRVLFKLKKNDKFFLLGILPISSIFLSLMNLLLKRNIYVCLHGQMEAYLETTEIGLTKYYYRISKFVFKQKDAIKYIIFGESIKNGLQHLFEDKKKIIVIDQPYIYPKIIVKIPKSKPYIISVIGRADSSKNIKELFSLLKEVKCLINNNSLIVRVLGKFNAEIPDDCKGLFKYYNDFISQKDLEEGINDSLFIVSFLDKNYYKVTPSGSFFDCVKYEKPIITLDNFFAEFYFNKYGDLGLLCSNVYQMADFIKRENQNIKQYNEFMINIQNLKKDLHTDVIAQKLNSLL